jgi:hypothetical protein
VHSWLPLVLLLACPLMMLFMMRGMGGMHGGRDNPTSYAGEDMHETGAPTSEIPDHRAERLAALELEVAELRAARGWTGVRTP